ncbi:zinc ABC transporter substrate-binding protein [Seohaeicola sp. SP36]|uniref:zinc ABC transporter substrate-binding protein n=1 Tax=unclassified Seohaeicola TaxID=2641111 RepID=UPI00237AADD0|nr:MULTISPECIES: zinc ABC transporter substrate-binding protein [unclassified Seohaeicola]MDD9707089.1 zinc ABC transporter substrate-binding protein [Seohaeicola sp. 4SK31]MDD9734199.1 zinc ABC transporter substrate-binding protein [Seohaeicola sp. SP36]
MRPLFRPAPFSIGLMASLLSTAALAEVPQVATDIAPVHSLVAQVMGDLGAPALIVRPGASPHGYAMRPSEAQALEQADLVVWIGEGLTPWLEGPVETLGEGAAVLELMSVEGTILHDYREGATFAAHDHGEHEGHDHDAAKGHDHDHDHAHDKAEAHDHDHDHDTAESHAGDHAGHDHSGADAHAWLDPANGRVWLGAIAAELSRLDPENAAAYAANAAEGQAELTALEAELTKLLAPMAETEFVVFHDAYQYFERRFGLAAAGAISFSDASAPSAGRIAELREAVADLGAACVFAEPQFSSGLVETVFGDSARVGLLDPLGQDMAPGADLYPQVLRSMAGAFTTCLGG